ncbi:TetR/AcrR family transcriptional regulator [Leifsonia sp. A12D58]|uniref:TetR/AcrR family transcriptional regulator n=1 Tax=Leifsonia sp. A12D58 TaxID=3397674 RepID=UPI0039E09F71
MSESATCQPGIRERRKASTRRQLTSNARRLTAERGLKGFTIEELCDEVGISRRTFFNYFPNKEHAVMGSHDDEFTRPLLEKFMEGRPEGCIGVSETLMPDLLELAVTQMNLNAISAEEARAFHAAIDKEPQLIGSVLKIGAEREKQLAEIITKREGMAPDDQTAHIAVVLMSALLRKSTDDYFAHGNTVPFEELIRGHFASAQSLFESPHPTHTP